MAWSTAPSSGTLYLLGMRADGYSSVTYEVIELTAAQAQPTRTRALLSLAATTLSSSVSSSTSPSPSPPPPSPLPSPPSPPSPPPPSPHPRRHLPPLPSPPPPPSSAKSPPPPPSPSPAPSPSPTPPPPHPPPSPSPPPASASASVSLHPLLPSFLPPPRGDGGLRSLHFGVHRSNDRGDLASFGTTQQDNLKASLGKELLCEEPTCPLHRAQCREHQHPDSSRHTARKVSMSALALFERNDLDIS